jgi:uncharacterized protein (TIGR03000 family)
MIALAAVVTLSAITPRAEAQYAVRGGPIYGGPVFGGGPSLFIGPYSQPYFGPYLSGAGFGSSYIGAYPRYNGYQLIGSAPIVSQSMYIPAAGIIYQQPIPYSSGILNNPPPPPISTPNGSANGLVSADQPPPPNTPPTTLQNPNPAPPPATGRAFFTVKVPADAKVWVNDIETKQTGVSRRFHTPPDLDPRKSYEYVFRAQWAEGGQTVTRDRTVRFKTGEDLPVDFTQAAAR